MVRWPRVRWPCVAAFMAGVALALAGAALQRAPRPVSVESPSVVLREEAARLRELRTIDREAQVLLRRQIADLTAQNGDLRRRLALLRGVLVADAHTADLGVADVQLAPSGERGQVAYRLLLARTPPATGKMGGACGVMGRRRAGGPATRGAARADGTGTAAAAKSVRQAHVTGRISACAVAHSACAARSNTADVRVCVGGADRRRGTHACGNFATLARS